MDWIRCNQCYTRIEKAKRSFSLVQCGHIFCNKCIVQAEKRCPECGTTEAMTISLKEPMPSNLVPYFTPVHDTLEQLLRTAGFQNNQMRIALRRFYDLEQKYEMMKMEYWRMQQKFKKFQQDGQTAQEKIYVLEMENRKLINIMNHRGISLSTEISSNHRKRNSQNSRFTPNNEYAVYGGNDLKLESRQRIAVTPIMKSTPKTACGEFLVPNFIRVPKSIATTSDTSSAGTLTSVRQRRQPFSNRSNYSNIMD